MAKPRTRVRKKAGSSLQKGAAKTGRSLIHEVVLPAECGSMPVSTVVWVKRENLHANDYNPNHVAPDEMDLLKLSIIEDGWTQPIVVRPDGEIVDGFHRWLCSEDPDVGGMTEFMVPVVILEKVDAEHQRMSTVRHNRARGTHAVLRMADIVRDLRDNHGMSPEDIQRRLGMEEEEYERLYSNADMRERGGADDFGKGWVPGD